MAAGNAYYHKVLKISVAQMCHDVGWHGINMGACDVLTDLLARYIHTLGKTASAFAEHDNHTTPHINDLYHTFQELGITTDGLEEYVVNVNLGVALEKHPPSLPVPQPQVHVFNGSDVRVLRKGRVLSAGALPYNEDKVELEEALLPSAEGEEGRMEGDGDKIEEGGVEGERMEGDAMEGERTEGDTMEGERTEGDTMEGERTEGDTLERERTEGDTMEGDAMEGDAMEGGGMEETQVEEGESDEEEWEEIPGYLPPFPETSKDKTDDKDDAESGIGLPEEEGLATPSSLLSPTLGTQGLPMLVYQRSVTSEDSRRSSASDETMATQEPTDMVPREVPQPASTVPLEPLVPVSLVQSSDSVMSPILSSSSSSERSVEERPPIGDSPPVGHFIKSPPEASLPMKPLEKGGLQRRGPKLTLPLQLSTEVGGLESPRMPQLRPLTHVTPLTPGLPPLSPLTKTPPTSPLIVTAKTLRPQLHPLTMITSPSITKQGTITTTTTTATDLQPPSSHPIKELKVKIAKLPSPIPFSPSPPSSVSLPLALPIKSPVHVAPPPTPPMASSLSPKSPREVTKSPSPAKEDYGGDDDDDGELSVSVTPGESVVSTPSPDGPPSAPPYTPPPALPSTPPSAPPYTPPPALPSTPPSAPPSTIPSAPPSTSTSAPPSVCSEELNLPSPHFDTPSPAVDSPFQPPEFSRPQEVHVHAPQVPTDDMYISSSSTSSYSSSLPLTPDAPPSQPYNMSPISRPLTPPQRSLTPPTPAPATLPSHVPLTPAKYDYSPRKTKVEDKFPSPPNPWAERDTLFPPSFVKKQKLSPLTDDIEEEDTTSESSLDLNPSTPQDRLVPKKRISPTIKLTKVTVPSPHSPSPRLLSISPEGISSLKVTIPKFTTVVPPSVKLPDKGSISQSTPSRDNLRIVSSKYETVDSIHPKVPKVLSPIPTPPPTLSLKSPSPMLLMKKSLSPRPLTLVVNVKRRHIMHGCAALPTPSPLSVEGVKVTIPKAKLMGSAALGVAKGQVKGHEGGKSKGKVKKGKKRGLQQELTPEPKKMKLHSPSPLVPSSEEEPVKSSHTRLGMRSRSLRSLSSEESDNKGELKIRLKLNQTMPKPPVAESKATSKKPKGGKKQLTTPIGTSPLLSSSPRDSLPTPPIGKSESLIITSSAPKPVPSIRLQKVTMPTSTMRGGASRDDDSEVYICPLCQKPDDGTPMICCDNCDIWLHMRCVGVTMAPPDDQQWYCPTCSRSGGKKKKSKKKKQH